MPESNDNTDLSAKFRKALDDNRKWWTESRVTDALRDISRVLAEIRDLDGHDLDIHIDWSGGASENAFAMIHGSKTVPISGVLHIGNRKHLLAISTQEGGNSVLKLYMSRFAIDQQGNRNRKSKDTIDENIRAICYDLKKKDGLDTFRDNVLNYVAKAALIEECDTHDSFGKNRDKPREIRKYKL